jgi:hypothetical protein
VSWVSLCKISGGQSGTGAGISSNIGFPLSVSYHQCLLVIHVLQTAYIRSNLCL